MEEKASSKQESEPKKKNLNKDAAQEPGAGKSIDTYEYKAKNKAAGVTNIDAIFNDWKNAVDNSQK